MPYLMPYIMLNSNSDKPKFDKKIQFNDYLWLIILIIFAFVIILSISWFASYGKAEHQLCKNIYFQYSKI